MKSKKGIIKIWFCLLLSLSLVVCGLSVAYAQTLETPAAPQSSTLGGDGVATGNAEGENAGAGAEDATGEAAGTGATGENGSEAAGTSGGGANGAVGGAVAGEGAAQGLLGSQLLTANGAEGGELLGAANSASTIDITVPTAINFHNGGLSPTVLSTETLQITNEGTETVSITSIAISAKSGYTLVADTYSQFDTVAQGTVYFSVVLVNNGSAVHDFGNSAAYSCTDVSLASNESKSFSFTGHISKVTQETEADFATLTLTIETADSTEANSAESDT